MRSILFLSFLSSFAMGWTHLGNNIRGWKNSTVTVYVNATNCPISESQLNEMVDTTISVWNGVTDSSLVIKRGVSTASVAEFLAGDTTELPVILCDPNFSVQVGGASVNVVPAATFSTNTDEHGNLSYSGILLNAESGAGANISLLTEGQVELTLAHEMGHALGLGHSSQKEALMYYSLGAKQQALLTEDDLDGIIQMYPRNEFTGGVMGCSSVHLSSTNNESFLQYRGGMTCLLLLVLVVYWGRTQFKIFSSAPFIKPERPL